MPYRFSKDDMREHWDPNNPRGAIAMGWGTDPAEERENRTQRRLQRSKERTPGTEEFEDRVAAKRGRYFVRRKSAKAERADPGVTEWLQQSHREFEQYKRAQGVDIDHHHRRNWLAANPGFDSQDYDDHMWLERNPGVHPMVREQEKMAKRGHPGMTVDLRDDYDGPRMYPSR